MTLDMNALPELWAQAMIRATLQGAIAIAVVFALGYAFSRYLSCRTQCWLWRLVFVKLLLLMLFTRPFEIPVLPAHSDHSRHELKSAVAKKFDSQAIAIPRPKGIYKSNGANTKFAQNANPGDQPDSTFDSNGGNVIQQSEVDQTFKTRIDYPTVFFAIWVAGVLASLVWLGTNWLAARKFRRNCKPLKDSRIRQHCRELCDHFGIPNHPRLAISELASSPLLIGTFNPEIVIPAKTLANLDESQLKLVIAHELSHLKRRDLWWSWIPTMVQILFFFHPLVWIARSRWLLSREMACDELVLSITGNSATSYADALINVSTCMSATKNSHISNAAFGSTCMVQTSFSLKRRIQAMKNFTNYGSSSFCAAFLFGLAALLAVIPWQPVQRQAVAFKPVLVELELDENNLDFETVDDNRIPTGWGGGGKGYELTISSDSRSGKFCGQIESIGEADQLQFGTYTGRLDVKAYQGKRVRYTGYLRSDMAREAWGGLWMRVDGEANAVAFDNMNKRPVKNRTDWTKYTIVLDVPHEAQNINFGFLISGAGTLWGDDFRFEVVGDIGEGPDVTDMMNDRAPAVGMNLNFEETNSNGFPTGWGGGGEGYKFTTSSNAHRGESSGQIESVGEPDQLQFGTFTGSLDVAKYHGKRVRYSGYLKSDMARDAWAGLWMRVDGESRPVAFDNMQQRAVQGRTNWTKYSIVLDIPLEAQNINFGFLISGEGTLWGDDLQFEVVGDIGRGPKVTDMMRGER